MAGSLVKRAVSADVHLWVDWATALRTIPNNPYGVEVRTFGATTAILAHAAPTSYFNRVIGMSSHDLDSLEDVITFYRDRQTPCRIDVPPVRGTALLSRRLIGIGWQAVEQQANLAAALSDLELSDAAPSDVVAREVSVDEKDDFAELYDRAYGLGGPPLLARFRQSALAARVGRVGWRVYVALVDGCAAGGGILHLSGDVATLSGGATLPDFRRRGIQSALLRRRLSDAREAGCEWVVSRCAVDSSSQRNLERVGLRLAYMKGIWENQPQETVATADGRSVITAA